MFPDSHKKKNTQQKKNMQVEKEPIPQEPTSIEKPGLNLIKVFSEIYSKNSKDTPRTGEELIAYENSNQYVDLIDFSKVNENGHLRRKDVSKEAHKRSKGMSETYFVSVKKIKIFHEEEFDFSPRLYRHDGKHVGFCGVIQHGSPEEICYDIGVHSENEALLETLKPPLEEGETVQNRMNDDGIDEENSFIVLPKDKIKPFYIEESSDDVTELGENLYTFAKVPYAFKIVKDHVKGCRCRKCDDEESSE